MAMDPNGGIGGPPPIPPMPPVPPIDPLVRPGGLPILVPQNLVAIDMPSNLPKFYGTYILQLSTHSTRAAVCCQHRVAILCQKRESRLVEMLFFDATPL